MAIKHKDINLLAQKANIAWDAVRPIPGVDSDRLRRAKDVVKLKTYENN